MLSPSRVAWAVTDAVEGCDGRRRSPDDPRPESSRHILDSAPALLTIRQVAAALQLGRSTLYRELLATGTLPVIRLGRRGRQVRIARDVVEEYLQAHESTRW